MLKKSGYALFAFIAAASPGYALNARSHVNAVGNDANDCSFDHPCLTFQRAHDQTNDNGEVVTIGGFLDTSPLVVTKGMKFYASGDSAAERSYIATSGNAVTVNLPANRAVSFVNFWIAGSTNGILFNSGSTLAIFDGVIQGANAPAPNGFGLKFQPNNVSVLTVRGANIFGNGNGSTGGGIQIAPVGAAGGAQVFLNDLRIQSNVFGFAIDTTNSSNGVNALIANARIYKNSQDGIITVGGAPIATHLRDTEVFANTIGVRAIGGNVTVRLGNNSIVGNGTGTIAVSGGSVQSYGNNYIDANANNGAAPALIPQR